MNSLSWFLYAADVAGTLKILLFIAVGIAAIGTFVLAAMVADGMNGQWVLGFMYKAAAMVAILLIVCIVVPSQKTLYAIAASEFGEKIVRSETVQGLSSDAEKALRQWIKRQIDPEKAN